MTFPQSAMPSPDLFAHDGLLRYLTLNGTPKWQNSNAPGTIAANNYPPASFDAYKEFLMRVGKEQDAIRGKLSTQSDNYYQVTWEPGPGPSTQWKGSAADFVALYRNAYEGLHATDPHAVVSGPA